MRTVSATLTAWPQRNPPRTRRNPRQALCCNLAGVVAGRGCKRGPLRNSYFSGHLTVYPALPCTLCFAKSSKLFHKVIKAGMTLSAVACPAAAAASIQSHTAPRPPKLVLCLLFCVGSSFVLSAASTHLQVRTHRQPTLLTVKLPTARPQSHDP